MVARSDDESGSGSGSGAFAHECVESATKSVCHAVAVRCTVE